MRRFWFEFDGSPAGLPPGAGYGVGVTALSYDDAIALVRRAVFKGAEFTPRRVVEDVDIQAPDGQHVRVNMGDPSSRGVWFPRGYS